MKEIMPWEKCKNEFLREVEIDIDKIKSLKETAEKRLKFIKQNKVPQKMFLLLLRVIMK